MSISKKTSVQLVKVSVDHDGQRLDNFLVARLKGLPRSALYRLIRTGQVRINAGRCKPSTRLREGDQVRIPPARVREPGTRLVSDQVCSQIRDSVLFKNSDLLVLNKPSGMAVHAGSGLHWGLIDVVRQLHPGEYCELAHRLDRETSGCLVLARNGKTLKHLAGLFRDGRVQKFYLCLLDGEMKQPMLDVNAPLKKVQAGAERQIEVNTAGKPALTRFRRLQSYAGCTYAEAELLTGRTHQIRVHACHIGMPLAGEARYASKESVNQWKKKGLHRVFLHAQRLSFETSSGEEMEFNAPLPENLKAVLDRLED
ncbi:MAG: RluA family pseudouridine synthase [Xanthomonadales bacterium]